MNSTSENSVIQHNRNWENEQTVRWPMWSGDGDGESSGGRAKGNDRHIDNGHLFIGCRWYWWAWKKNAHNKVDWYILNLIKVGSWIKRTQQNRACIVWNENKTWKNKLLVRENKNDDINYIQHIFQLNQCICVCIFANLSMRIYVYILIRRHFFQPRSVGSPVNV